MGEVGAGIMLNGNLTMMREDVSGGASSVYTGCVWGGSGMSAI